MIAAGAAVFVLLALLSGATAFALPLIAATGADRRVRALTNGGAIATPNERSQPARRRAASSIPALERWLTGSLWAESTAQQLQRAGLQLRVGEYLLARLLLACLAFAAPMFLLGVQPAPFIVGLAAACAGLLLPPVFVRSLYRRRVAQIEKQLGEFLPSLASSLRSGFALQHGIEAAAHQLGPPLSGELVAFLNDVRLGATVENALLEMSRRLGSTDLDMVVTAMLVQRTTGGSLAEVLEQAAETLRDRERIRGDVQTFTAQQRLTGLILSIYPLAIGLLLFAIMPATWSKMFTEPVGQVQLALAAGLQVTGFLWIRRALQVEV
jgi:tight adherence protein B